MLYLLFNEKIAKTSSEKGMMTSCYDGAVRLGFFVETNIFFKPTLKDFLCAPKLVPIESRPLWPLWPPQGTPHICSI